MPGVLAFAAIMRRPSPLPSICLLLALATLTACSAPRIQTTRLGSADLVAMTDAMVSSLLAADALAGRDEDSDPWIVTLDRVSNQTNDVMPRRELWAFMARLRSQISQSDELRRRNVQFVVPAEFAKTIGERHDDGAGRARPTHALTATFHALTNRQRTGRTDTYVCAFQLLDLRTDELTWEDSYEVKRAVARGTLD